MDNDLSDIFKSILDDSILEDEIMNLKKELEAHYMKHNVLYMHPEDWDDIMYISRSWQQRMREVINAKKD